MVSNFDPVIGDETYDVSVFIADKSVLEISSSELCDNLLFLITQAKYDFFMLKGKFIGRANTKTGFIDAYNSIYGGEIDVYQKGAREYFSVLYKSIDIKEAKGKLDEYIVKVKKCFANWNLTQEEYEDFDEELGENFGTVRYTAFFKKDNFPYALETELKQDPNNNNYLISLLFSLDYDKSNY